MGPPRTIFFPRVILYIFLLFLLIYGDLGLGSYFGLLGLGFSVDSVWEKYIYIYVYVYVTYIIFILVHS